MEGSRKENMNKKRRSSNQNLISRQKKAKCNGDRNPYWIPLDLTIEVLKRLPVKTLMKVRRVSKLWYSIIRSREFVNLFFDWSSTRPLLLATFPNHHCPRTRFFPTPCPTEISSSLANLRLNVRGLAHLFVCKSVNGLVYVEDSSVLKICNPATKQFITLPAMTITRILLVYSLKNYFAYDPIDDQYKVLSGRLYLKSEKRIMEHQIFVLGENAWRRIQSAPVHKMQTDGFCLNGILYYGARMHDDLGDYKIVAFNVKHENFKFINMPAAAGNELSINYYTTLINFEGKLAIVDYYRLERDNAINVWVLEDDTKGEWSEKSYVLPSSWKDLFIRRARDFPYLGNFIVTGAIYTDEIIIAPRTFRERFHVVYYNMKTNSLRKVEIKGLLPNPAFMRVMRLNVSSPGLTFTEYVETIKPLDGLGTALDKQSCLAQRLS